MLVLGPIKRNLCCYKASKFLKYSVLLETQLFKVNWVCTHCTVAVLNVLLILIVSQINFFLRINNWILPFCTNIINYYLLFWLVSLYVNEKSEIKVLRLVLTIIITSWTFFRALRKTNFGYPDSYHLVVVVCSKPVFLGPGGREEHHTDRPDLWGGDEVLGPEVPPDQGPDHLRPPNSWCQVQGLGYNKGIVPGFRF